MKLKHTNKKTSGFTLVELLVVIAIIASLAAISSPIIIKQIARSRATQAINNAKDISISIKDAALKNGVNMPVNQGNSNLTLGTYIGLGYIVDEKPFFVNGVPGAVEGDGDISGCSVAANGATTLGSALEQNSNVFSTFDDGGSDGINVITSEASVPLLATPVVTAGAFNAMVYQQSAFGGQAVVLLADGSAAAHPLNPSNGIADASITTITRRDSTDDSARYTSVLPDLASPLDNS